MAKWQKTKFPGVRVRESDSRRYQGKPDKYFTIRFADNGLFADKPRIKYIVYLSSKIYPTPLFFAITTTDKSRKIPTLNKARQMDIIVIPPGDLDFFQDPDHTFIDLNNSRDIEFANFEQDYDNDLVVYVGSLSNQHICHLLDKTKNSKILRPEHKRRILGY